MFVFAFVCWFWFLNKLADMKSKQNTSFEEKKRNSNQSLEVVTK